MGRKAKGRPLEMLKRKGTRHSKYNIIKQVISLIELTSDLINIIHWIEVAIRVLHRFGEHICSEVHLKNISNLPKIEQIYYRPKKPEMSWSTASSSSLLFHLRCE